MVRVNMSENKAMQMNSLKTHIIKFRKLLKIFVISTVALFQMSAISIVQAIETVFWVDSNLGVALGGYDPISYFIRGRGVEGSDVYEYFWAGAVWRFENEGNLKAFRDSPLIYSPQFGGFDATKMSVSVQVSPDPRYSDVFENRLYLFHSQKNLDIWKQSRSKFVKSARSHWLDLNVYSINKNFVVDQIAKAKEPIDILANAKMSKDKNQTDADDASETAAKAAPINLSVGNSPSGGLDSRQRLSAAGKQFKDAR